MQSRFFTGFFFGGGGIICNFFIRSGLNTRLRGRTTTHASKTGSEKVLGRVPGKGSQKGFCYGFCSREGFSEGVLRSGASRRCLQRPFGEYDPLGVLPNISVDSHTVQTKIREEQTRLFLNHAFA